MCSVEIFRHFNPIMRRANTNRIEHSTPKRPECVRRVLFGAPLDHEATSRALNRHLNKIEDEARERWNFDFGAEGPLPGRYQWRRVNVRSRDSDNVPSGSEGSPSSSPQTWAQESEAPLDEGLSQTEETKEVLGKTESSTATAVKHGDQASRKVPVQRKVTDYMSQRKRPSTSAKMASSSLLTSVTKRKLSRLDVSTASAVAGMSRSSSAASSSSQPPT